MTPRIDRIILQVALAGVLALGAFGASEKGKENESAEPSEKEDKSGQSNGNKLSARDGYVNTLGVRFNAVPGTNVLFSVWLTRVKDFEVFAKATAPASDKWRTVGFKQEANHPVVNVTWDEAVAFCGWLTTLEHEKGTLPKDLVYRLPTDLEWSAAVDLKGENGATPEQRDMSTPGVYGWGTQWPPPEGAGNFTGTETGSDVAIKGYNDGYVWTSPVGSFRANKFGLFDMSGNAWEWTSDNWSETSQAKVLRGGSWYNGALKLSLLASCRVHCLPAATADSYGFRVVVAQVDGAVAAEKK